MTSVLPELQAVQPIAHVVLIMLLTHQRALVHRVRVCLGMDRQVALEDEALPEVGDGQLLLATVAGSGIAPAARRACERVVEVLDASAAANSAEMLVFPGPRA